MVQRNMGRSSSKRRPLLSPRADSKLSADNPVIVEARNEEDVNKDSRNSQNGNRKDAEKLNGGEKLESNSLSVESPLACNFGKLLYPTVCSYCHTLWDKKGDTDLLTPCGCNETKLHIHQSCLKSQLKEHGRVRCEQCKTVCSDVKFKELEGQVAVQKANMCVIVVLMPIGVIITVAVCLMIDAIRRAREKSAATGEPINGFGIPLEEFIVLCIVLGALSIAALFITKSIMLTKTDNRKESNDENIEKM